MSETKLFIYMLCFDDHMSHARHYIGITADINQRLQTHFDGRGARLTQVLKERGLGFTLARVWVAGERQAEAAIKRQSNAPRFCPICHPGDYQKSFRNLQPVSRATLIRSGIKINYPREEIKTDAV